MPDIWWTTLGYYALAALSGVAPWVNAELLMLTAVPLAGSPVRLGVLVGAVTMGQMTGKTAMYWMARCTTRPPAVRGEGARLRHALDRCRTRFERRPGSALAITFASSTLGCPPFYVVSMVAGTLQMAFLRFLAVGTLGRLIHFGCVAFLPQLVWTGP